MRAVARAWVVFLVLLSAAATARAEIPLADFARTDTYSGATLSPDGRYLAARVPIGKDFGVAVIDRVDGKPMGKLSVGEDRSIEHYAWVSPTRLVLSLSENFGLADAPWLTGEIMAIDVDGKALRYIFGGRGEEVRLGTRLGRDTKTNAWGFLIRTLPKDPKHILVASYAYTSVADRLHAVAMRVDVMDGKRDEEVGAPLNGWVMFSADDDGFVRYVSGYDEQNRWRNYVRSPEQPEWRLLESELGSDKDVPSNVSADKTRVFLTTIGQKGGCLVRADLGSGKRENLSCDPEIEVRNVIWSFDRQAPVAVLYDGPQPRIHVFDAKNRSGAIIAALQNSFPGHVALPVSYTQDGKKLILYVYSGRNPGDYYLFDVSTMGATFLLGRNKWVDPELMAERRPVEFNARDGVRIHGYLTLPKGRELKGLPMVVLPHGGPFGSYDQWNWDEDPQLLASRGYLVLQVNFRGSGNYGQAFEDAGKQAWDSVMIDDISDGVRWTLGQGFADPQRLCIYGGSYGGYVALMSAVRAPDLYRCAVGYAGVYDLARFAKDTDIAESRRGRSYLSDFVGATPERLKAASPLTYIERLKANVLIVHGTRDERVPFSQAEMLRDALDARHLPYEWLAKTGEGHGFYTPEDRLELYQKLVDFLDRNIGSGATPAVQ